MSNALHINRDEIRNSEEVMDSNTNWRNGRKERQSDNELKRDREFPDRFSQQGKKYVKTNNNNSNEFNERANNIQNNSAGRRVLKHKPDVELDSEFDGSGLDVALPPRK
jgi:hypothetical protein